MAPCSTLSLILFALIGCTFAQDVENQRRNCLAPVRVLGQQFPDIYSLTKQAFKLQVEGNYPTLMMSHYITEYYDRIEKRGKIEFIAEGETTRILNFMKSDELFVYRRYTCDSRRLSTFNFNDVETPFTAWNWIKKDEGSDTVVGPSAYFVKALEAWNRQEKIGASNVRVPVRGMQATEWVWCVDANSTIKFYFSDPASIQPYGLDNVPLRVTGEGYWNNTWFTESLEFVGLQVEFSNEELNSIFQIPAELGCTRSPDLIEEKSIPEFKNSDFYVATEIVYSPFNDLLGYTYVRDIWVWYDKNHGTDGLVAFKTTPWKVHDDVKSDINTGDSKLRIWDAHYGVAYEIDDSTDNCNITQFPNSLEYTTDLPDGQKYQLWNNNVSASLLGGDKKKYHYFGEGEERGLPVSIFQEVKDDLQTLDEVVTVRSYLADNAVLENQFQERNAPIRKTDSSWGLATGDEFSGMLVMNYYSYQSRLTKKHQLFDLQRCFPEDNQSKWVQILFPMDNYETKDVMPLIPFLKDNFVGVLLGTIQVNSNLRIPRLEVDVDSDYIYVTLLLLERHNPIWDFTKEEGLTFKDGTEGKTRVVGPVTLEDCAKSCIDEQGCQYFSYCGAVCTKAVTKVNSPQDLQANALCQMYNSVAKPDRSPTMAGLTKKIAGAVELSSLMIDLSDKKGGIMSFTATTFKDNIAFGLQGLSRKPEGMSLENRISVFRSGFKFVDKLSSFHGKTSFLTCKQYCVDSANCETMSYCLATRECYISDVFVEEITDNSQFEANTQCMILRRNYEDHFEKMPGFVVTKTAQKSSKQDTLSSCAAACFKESTFQCLSFDYQNLADPNVNNCLLHKKHYKNVDEPESLKVAVEFTHYSRKLLYEYKRTPERSMVGNEVGTIIQNVTPESCAQYCKSSTVFTCVGFDFCADNFSTETTCTLFKTSNVAATENKKCSAFINS